MRGWPLLVLLAACGDGDAPRCWSTAADTHDEDADGVRDPCDNCPHVANANQKNADDDQLGDACDPDAATAECIATFDGFAAMPAQTPNSAGAWSIDSDTFVQTDAAFDNAQWIVETAQRLSPFVVAGGTVRSPAPLDVVRSVGLVQVMSDAFMDNFPRTAFLTELTNTRVAGGNDASALHVAHFYDTSIDDFFFQQLAPATPMARGAFELRVDLRRTPITIRAAHAGAENTATVTTFAPLVAGRIALRTHGLSAGFDYVLVAEACAD